MGALRNGQATLIAPFDPVPAVLRLAQRLARHAEFDPKIQEAAALVGARLKEVDEKDLAELIAPLLWSWARNIPICPPGFPGPHRPQPAAGAEAVIGDGNRLLPATEVFLDNFLDSQSLEALSNEVARWSRRTSRNADLLSTMQEEYGQFQDECGKLREQRKFGIDDAIGIALIAVAGASVGAMVSVFAR